MSETREADVVTPITDERRRLLDNQVSFTDTVRNRATAMLTAASIVAGLFGSRIATEHQSRPELAAIAAALLLFALSALLSIRLMMLKDLRVGVDTSALLERLDDTNASSTAYGMNFTLAKRYGEEYDLNVPVVERLNCQYKWLCLLVGAQVIAWGLAVLL